MRRRDFHRGMVALGIGASAGLAQASEAAASSPAGDYCEEPARRLPIRQFDVVVAGGGTAGVVAATAAARQGAKTALIEQIFLLTHNEAARIGQRLIDETRNTEDET